MKNNTECDVFAFYRAIFLLLESSHSCSSLILEVRYYCIYIILHFLLAEQIFIHFTITHKNHTITDKTIEICRI